MEKVKITRIYRTDKDKNGNHLVSQKTGRPYSKCSIKCEQYGDKWIGGFSNQTNQSWKEGDEVEIEITQNGNYLNFKTPNKNDQLDQVINALANRVAKLEEFCYRNNTVAGIPEPDKPKPEAQQMNDELPF